MKHEAINDLIARQQQFSSASARPVEMGSSFFKRFIEKFRESMPENFAPLGMVTLGAGLASGIGSGLGAGPGLLLASATVMAGYAALGATALAKTMLSNKAAMNQTVEAASASNQQRDQQTAQMRGPAPR